LQELRNIPIVGDVRGMGLMGCVESVVDSGQDDALALDKEMGARIDEHCQRLGLIVRPLINMNVFSPPLIITREQIDDMVDRLRKGISNAWDDVRRQPSGASQKRTLATGGPSPT
jgi:adenosylmethionine-8-amino-7-oxononanoate aminotransferase